VRILKSGNHLYTWDLRVSLSMVSRDKFRFHLPFSFSTHAVGPRFINGECVKEVATKICNVRIVLCLATRIGTEEGCWSFQSVEMLVNMIKKCCLS
jgi:hypothetical protein